MLRKIKEEPGLSFNHLIQNPPTGMIWTWDEAAAILQQLEKAKLVTEDQEEKHFISDVGNKILEDDDRETKANLERQSKQDQINNLTIEKLVDEIIKSPKIEDRLKRAEIIAGVCALAAVASAIAAIAMLQGC